MPHDHRAPSAANTTDLSVIVVSYNTIELTRACLASLFDAATRMPPEVWVVDNASEDGSADMVAAEFPSVRLIRNAENCGFAAANNQAIAKASGRYILLLNSDTVVLGDVLQASIDYMDAHEDVGVLGCQVLNPDGSIQYTCSQEPTLVNSFLLTSGLSRLSWPPCLNRYQLGGWQRDSEKQVPVVSGCYFFVRTQAFQQTGLLDERFFFFAEETDWCKRARADGWTVVFSPVGQIIHYGGGSAWKLGSERDILLFRSKLIYHDKHNGVAGKIAIYIILLSFIVSRYIYWFCKSFVSPGRNTLARRDHFAGVLKGLLFRVKVC